MTAQAAQAGSTPGGSAAPEDTDACITRQGRAGIGRYEAAMAAALLEQADTTRALLALLGVSVHPWSHPRADS